jgi:hypothetical protein
MTFNEETLTLLLLWLLWRLLPMQLLKKNLFFIAKPP